MDVQLEEYGGTDGYPDNIQELHNGGVSGKIEAFNGLAVGKNLQPKHGQNVDLPSSKISELMKLGSLESASTHSLFGVVSRALDDSIETKNEDIPQRVASVLKLVIQELEQRVSKHADYVRKQNNLYKSREDRYQSKIKTLESLASGATEENEAITSQLQEIKLEKMKLEEKKKLEEKELNKLRKEKDRYEDQISSLNEELMLAKQEYEQNYFQLEAKAEQGKDMLQKKIVGLEQELIDLRKEKDRCEGLISLLNEELISTKIEYEQSYMQLEAKVEQNKDMLQAKIVGREQELIDLRNEYDTCESQILSLKEDLTSAKKDYEQNYSQLEAKAKQDQDKLQKEILELEQGKDMLQKKIVGLEQELIGLRKEHDICESQISSLKEDLTLAKKEYEQNYSQLEAKAKQDQDKLQKEMLELEQDLINLRNEKDMCECQISSLKEELSLGIKDYEQKYIQLEAKAEQDKDELQKKIVELEHLLTDSKHKVQELEDFIASESLRWKRKEHQLENIISSQFLTLQELRSSVKCIKEDSVKTRNIYAEEIYKFGVNIKELVNAAQNYHSVFEENLKLYNEVQDLKGNIRVYCRIKPFLPGETEKPTTVQFIGEDGELVVANPSKPGKDTQRLFRFNKVFGPAATQEDVFQDTQQLIRSVLDGYNVCIFAYGQTGSGKTYTMTGPNMTSVEDWGVNYRALNDLFNISENRQGSMAYEVGVQMVEIYNEQVHDLLRGDNSLKRLGIARITQPNGLAVPDASMHPVTSTNDVLDLMKIGLMNRAVGSTALNERSSRSHSILSVHVHGTDLETKSVLHGCLHLVDLAGSERIDRSDVAGDRLREAQHINKSLSALGDVIFALAQKSPHVPYRNSKLTQVLQSSLGGRAKTLMFVQLNPEVKSYAESLSTLKFAERVSGVELGAASTNKKGKGITELTEQVASLKEAVGKKDEEIRRLRFGNVERRGINSPKYGSALPRSHSVGAAQAQPSRRLPRRKTASEKAASDLENSSEYSDKHSEVGSPQSVDDLKHHREFFKQSRLAAIKAGNIFLEDNELGFDLADQGKDPTDDVELIGFGDDDSEERLSDISDSVLSMGTEADGSVHSIVEYTLFPEEGQSPPPEITEKHSLPINLPRPPTRQGQARSSRASSTSSKSSSKTPSIKRVTSTVSSSAAPKPPKRWQ